MKQRTVRATFFVGMLLTLVPLVGCGGGDDDSGDNGGGDAAFFRTLLAGDGATAADGATTTKTWRLAASRGKDAGADAPCVEDEYPETDVCGTTMYRSDGRLTPSSQKGTFGYPRFTDRWEFDGSTLIQTLEVSANTFKTSYAVTQDPDVDGKQRLRLRVTEVIDPAGSHPDQTGGEIVLEEVP